MTQVDTELRELICNPFAIILPRKREAHKRI